MTTPDDIYRIFIPMPSPQKIFISYSHKDRRLKDEFISHISSMRRENIISDWHDGQIVPGKNFDEKIISELYSSDIFVFLISPNFLSSVYCIEKEMKAAFKRAKSGQAYALPVILAACDWANLPVEDGRLGDFLALPIDGKPVKKFPHRDDAWMQVINALRAIAAESMRLTIQTAVPRADTNNDSTGDVMRTSFESDLAMPLASFRTVSGEALKEPKIIQLFFNLNNPAIPTAADQIVETAAKFVREGLYRRVTVTGHCDGREKSNALSSARASAVVHMLQSLGVSEEIIEVAWHGDRYADGHWNSLLKRRVEIGLGK